MPFIVRQKIGDCDTGVRAGFANVSSMDMDVGARRHGVRGSSRSFKDVNAGCKLWHLFNAIHVSMIFLQKYNENHNHSQKTESWRWR